MGIKIQNIRKTFGKTTVLKNISLNIKGGELMALLGPSGSGKTTLLRIIAGLELSDDAESIIYFSDKNIADVRIQERGVGFVFQNYALFRHMTVFQNVAFGLCVKPKKVRPSREAIREKVHELLKLVQLEQYEKRYPSQLSGGQCQRVALARALAIEPAVLLLDEPFGALDAKVRHELRRWIRELHDKMHITSIFVTHDQEEALNIADRIAIMNEGEIEQIGTPEEVFNHPASEFVMKFLGNVNIFNGTLKSGTVCFGSIAANYHGAPTDDKKEVRVYIRSYDFDVATQRNGKPCIKAHVRKINPTGALVKLELNDEDGRHIVIETTHHNYATLHVSKGSEVFITPQKYTVFAG